MIGEDVLEQVYAALSLKPQHPSGLALRLHMDLQRLEYVLGVLRRQGRAERIRWHKCRCMWVKAASLEGGERNKEDRTCKRCGRKFKGFIQCPYCYSLTCYLIDMASAEGELK